MENLRETVCKNFNRLIDLSDLSQKYIADKIGVTTATMQRWKKGENPPDLDNIQALASLFNVDPSDFYKADIQIKPLVMPVSKTLQKMMKIPDEVYERASRIDIDDSIWEDAIIPALVHAEERKRLANLHKT